MADRDINWAEATEEELRAAMNAPRSDGENVLAAKADEWAVAGDMGKALDCAQAGLILYQDRMKSRVAAKLEWDMRREEALNAALLAAAKGAALL